jgi:CheY-like chemotaxis protein
LSERAAFKSSLVQNLLALYWTFPGCNGRGVKVEVLSISGGGASVCEADRRFPVRTLLTTSAPQSDPGVSPDSDFEVRVVVIDGRPDRRQLMSYVVEQADHVTVVGYADGPVSALEAVGRLGANAVVLEIQLPVTQGLDTISALRDDFPALAIIVCSFHADATTKRDALARGADAYLLKPLSLRDLRAALRSAPANRSGQVCS